MCQNTLNQDSRYFEMHIFLFYIANCKDNRYLNQVANGIEPHNPFSTTLNHYIAQDILTDTTIFVFFPLYFLLFQNLTPLSLTNKKPRSKNLFTSQPHSVFLIVTLLFTFPYQLSINSDAPSTIQIPPTTFSLSSSLFLHSFPKSDNIYYTIVLVFYLL